MKNVFSLVTLMVLGSSAVMAQGTEAGTEVKNTASLSFKVGGVEQTGINSNDDTFIVDRKIDVVIAVNNSPKETQPGAQQVKLNFTVANQGNGDETWTLALEENGGDDFDVDTLSDCHLFDSTGTDLGLFSQDIAFNMDENKTFEVACDIPADATDSQNAEIFLTATIKDRTNNAGDADLQATEQNIFAEGDSDNGDAKWDGKFTKGGTYHISSATLAFEKTSIVTADELGSSTPHRIPGSTVRYCFDIKNTGSADAQNIRLTEDLTVTNKDKLDYVKSGIIVQAIGTCDCAGITDTSGTPTASATTVNIPEDTAGVLVESDKQACAYLEATVK